MPRQSVSENPLVSVIVPACNAEPFIAWTLASVLDQTYSNIEVLVVDDGSRDRTAAIVASIAAGDARVMLFRTANHGVAAARNLAIQHARGAYIAPLDADDIWYPQKLRKQVDYLNHADPGVGLVYAWSVYIDEHGRLTGASLASSVEGDAYLPLVYSNIVGNASAPLIRRTCLERVGGYDSGYREQRAQGCEDRELYLRLAEYYRFGLVPEFLVGYRQVDGSMSSVGDQMARAHTLLLQEIRRLHPEIPGHVLRWSRSRSCWYLGQKCTRRGDPLRALGLLTRALTYDPVLLCNRQLYALLFRNCTGLLPRRSGAAAGVNGAVPDPPDDAFTLADIAQRRVRHRRLWQRINARRLRALSQLRLSQPRAAEAGWRGGVAGQARGASSWHRP